MTRFGEKLQFLRKMHGLTIRKLGSMLGVHHTFISHMEKSKATPNAAMILKIANLFQVTTDELMRDELELK